LLRKESSVKELRGAEGKKKKAKHKKKKRKIIITSP